MAYPFALAKDIGPLDFTKGFHKRGYQYGDYFTFPTTAVEANYVIGTNSFIAEPVRYAEFASVDPGSVLRLAGAPGFVADEMAIVVTQDTLIRTNTPTKAQELLLAANSPYMIRERCYRIYAVRSAVNGILYVIAEGNSVRIP